MRILAIGNIFESKSFLVDEFCEKEDNQSSLGFANLF